MGPQLLAMSETNARQLTSGSMPFAASGLLRAVPDGAMAGLQSGHSLICVSLSPRGRAVKSTLSVLAGPNTSKNQTRLALTATDSRNAELDPARMRLSCGTSVWRQQAWRQRGGIKRETGRLGRSPATNCGNSLIQVRLRHRTSSSATKIRGGPWRRRFGGSCFFTRITSRRHRRRSRPQERGLADRCGNLAKAPTGTRLGGHSSLVP